MYSDLAYFAYGRGSLGEKVGVYVREHGLAGLRDAVTPAVAARNIADMDAWLAAHPLAADASEETRQERALMVAALERARAQTATAAQQQAAAATFATAQRRYQVFAAAQSAKETPSAFALWLADHGLDLTGTLGKVALFGALGLAAYLVLPMLMPRRGR